MNDDPFVYLLMSFVVLAAFIILVSNVARPEEHESKEDGGPFDLYELNRRTGEWRTLGKEERHVADVDHVPYSIRLTQGEAEGLLNEVSRKRPGCPNCGFDIFEGVVPTELREGKE